jgi:hypothetical protein
MRGLKIFLWIGAVLCLLSAIGMFLPCSVLCGIARAFGVEPTTDSPLLEYGARTILATYAAVGVYLVILALNPMKYGVLVPFTGAAALFLGLVCAVAGMAAEMPPKWFLSDSLSCIVWGVLILIFWRKARSVKAGN